jgi:hypothetical protein
MLAKVCCLVCDRRDGAPSAMRRVRSAFLSVCGFPNPNVQYRAARNSVRLAHPMKFLMVGKAWRK